MKAICIIPAKKISKRIPKKNIRKFMGRPMIANVILNILKSKCFDQIFVSTNSIEIKKISERYGAKVPFMRSNKLSNSRTGTIDVLIDSINKLKKIYKFETVCCVYPTSIFATPKIIKKAMSIIKTKSIKFVFSAKKYEHPVQRAFIIKKNKIKAVNQNNFFKRTQDFEDQYFDAGQFYIANFRNFLLKKNQFDLPSKAIIFNRFSSIDIDNFDDLKDAEKIVNLKLNL